MLTVIADELAEGTETLALGIGGGVNPGSPDSASAEILDKPSQDEWFHTVPDPALRGAADDGDGDTLENIVEYFMGTDAGDATSRGGLTVTWEGPAGFSVHFPMPAARVDVTGALFWSTDLQGWFPSGGSDGTRTVTFSDPVAAPTAEAPNQVEVSGTIDSGPAPAALFLRLVVDSP